VVKSKDFVFEGFRYPTYTQVPDEVFDVLMPDLTEAELKCLLYIVRRTFGFRKDSDAIATKQFIEGIVTRDGRLLDRGTGLSSKGVWSGLKGLEEKKIIEVERRLAPDGDYEINVYRLRFLVGEGVTTLGSNPYYLRKEPVTTSGSIQHTVEQETVLQETDLSKFERSPAPIQENRRADRDISSVEQGEEEIRSANITRIMTDFSLRVLHDRSHVKSNITQAHNIWNESGLEEEAFIDALREAKRIALKWSGNIRKKADEEEGLKNRAPYFFRVLRNLVLPGES